MIFVIKEAKKKQEERSSLIDINGNKNYKNFLKTKRIFHLLGTEEFKQLIAWEEEKIKVVLSMVFIFLVGYTGI
jgi:hypothetical protein